MAFSNALGQEGEDIVNFKVVSNTSDFANNNPDFFRVNPYNGIEFDRRFPWYVSALSASIPFDRNPLVENSIWYKRLQISSDKQYTGAEGLYDTLFNNDSYEKAIGQCRRICFPEQKAKALLIGKNATKSNTIPQEFLNFFNCKYVNRVPLFPHQWPGTAIEMNVYPLLTIEKTTSSEAHDLFQLTIQRTENDGNSRVLQSTPLNERGYVEIIRMSRTLELLLGLNTVQQLSSDNDENSRSFPKFISQIFGKRSYFSKDMFMNPPVKELERLIKRTDLKKSGFWGNLLNHFKIPMAIIKLYQSYDDEAVFQGGNLDESVVSSSSYLQYQFRNQEKNRKEQYSDYFIVTTLKTGESLSANYYGSNPLKKWNNVNVQPIANNPHMMQLSRGITWSVSNYVRYPLGIDFTVTGDFIEDNIYSGEREKTLLNEQIPLDIKHQYPFSKFYVPIKVPLSNEMMLSNSLTLSFATKRQLRSYLHLTQKKLSTFKHKALKQKEVKLKSYKYPILLTLRAIAQVDNQQS